MPHLPFSIELHDSRLAEIRHDGASTTIRLSPAYVHRDGKGWSQEAELVIAGGIGDALDVALPVQISDGSLKTAQGPYQNLLTLPLDDHGPVVLELELVSGGSVRFTGKSVKIGLIGQAEFIENVA